MEKYQWDLTSLYKDLNDPRLEEDINQLEEKVTLSQAFFKEERQDLGFLKDGIDLLERVSLLSKKIFYYTNLVIAADTSNTKALGILNKARKVLVGFNSFQVQFSRKLASIDLEKTIQEAGLQDYSFILNEIKESGSYLLSEAEEEILAQTNIYGVNAWENLFDQLTSKLAGEYRGEIKSLSELRNMAYDPDPMVRQDAYEAELALYPKVEDSLASALSSIKGHVNTIARKRGYEDALEEALHLSRMDRQTCMALIQAMEDNLEIFHRYFKAKAKLLGQEKLHWKDLFAPVGKLPAGYSVSLSKKALVDSFSSLHPPIADLIERAYDENWIDFLPREGKVGGAFCENLGYVKESRILTNFDGSFNAVDTLAHELGHAYHGSLIEDLDILNQDYSMPVAETASTFNEIHFLLDVMEKAQDKEDKLGLLESFLMGHAQTICDILSRYLFEKEVFERVDNEILGAQDLCQIMHKAQLKAYGEALEEGSLHPYMWACKGHYYSASLSYYNFPYAFGSLYAMGIYKKAISQEKDFMKNYDKMLEATTTASCEDVGALVGIDLRQENFWKEAMEAFLPYVEEFEGLVD